MKKTISHQPLAISQALFQEAKRYMPGGVNSPVRSFKAVDGQPIFIKEGRGSKIYSEDGREFIDYCLSWGALILGHSHPEVKAELKKAIDKGTSFGTPTKLETKLAKIIIEAIPSIESLRLTNSGTEAAMSAIRLARAYTKKDKIIKFEGSYHGHADYLLNCEGVPEDFERHTLVVPYNSIEKVQDLVRAHKEDIAAIIVEPVAANMGVVLPKDGFLKALRELADKYGIVLIFDEVITGFRAGYSGAQGFFGIRPDMTCLGKIIGGGMPIGAFGGRKNIMKLLAPEGNVYQAGTFSGNPISVTAGITTLEILKNDNPYQALEKTTNSICEKIHRIADKDKIKLKVNKIASIFSVFFTEEEVVDYDSARSQDRELFKKFFHHLLEEGVYLSPSGLEANFLSLAHTAGDLKETIEAIDKALTYLRR